jgi:dienelactone hydrolase
MKSLHALLAASVVSAALVSIALPAAEIPNRDQRNVVFRHTDATYEMPQYSSLRQWKERAAVLREEILFSSGMLPLPEKTPLNAQVFGKIEHEDYSVEKVIIETYPGFFLGGNLYRPAGKSRKLPGIVSPHGHWRYGRLENQALNSIPARGVSLARQGYVAFTYDMIGYNDTAPQIPHRVPWGNKAHMWGIGILGTQLWNSIRAVDFIASLPGVDPERIGATGASGGGTQVFVLAAVDGRIKFSAPVNMISSIMQGGDYCENAPNLRLHMNNMEIGAMMAPRPMMMISATGDWTKNTPNVEYPAIKSIYKLYGAEDEVEQTQFDSPHNYHQDSREAVYTFFGKKVLGDNDASHFKEKGVRVDQLGSYLSFWGRPAPETPKDTESFVEARIREADQWIESLRPRDSASLQKARDIFRKSLSLSIAARLPEPNELASDLTDTLRNGEVLLIGRSKEGDRIPAVLLRPRRARASVAPTLIVHPEGTAWTLSSSESLDGMVRALLERGGSVAAIDVFQTAHARDTRDIAGAGDSAEKHFTTFNRTDSANRIQDVLTAITYFRTRLNVREINLVGMGEGGIWSLFARALADDGIHLIADLDQFDAASDAEFESKLYIPHIRKAGDFRAASVLLAGHKTLLHNVNTSFPSNWIESSFSAAEAQGVLELQPSALSVQELIERISPGRKRR